MTEKCKLNDLAKDLGVSNKELIDLIEAVSASRRRPLPYWWIRNSTM